MERAVNSLALYCMKYPEIHWRGQLGTGDNSHADYRDTGGIENRYDKSKVVERSSVGVVVDY